MAEVQKTITINDLFKGEENSMRRAIMATLEGLSAKDVSRLHIEPILSVLEANAGQPMDPLYIAYMIQHATK